MQTLADTRCSLKGRGLWSPLALDHYGFCQPGLDQSTPSYTERGGVLDALLMTRPHRPLALWLQLGKDRREHGLRQEATPSPHSPPEALALRE